MEAIDISPEAVEHIAAVIGCIDTKGSFKNAKLDEAAEMLRALRSALTARDELLTQTIHDLANIMDSSVDGKVERGMVFNLRDRLRSANRAEAQSLTASKMDAARWNALRNMNHMDIEATGECFKRLKFPAIERMIDALLEKANG